MTATDNFERTANTPQALELSSRELWTAAQILKDRRLVVDNSAALKDGDPVPPELTVRPVEMMLRGFALENLLKALWVKQKNPIVSGNKYIGVTGAGDHDLVQLADAVGLPTGPESRDVLKRLSAFITFVGRYPIPAHAQRGLGVWWRTPLDDETLNAISQNLQ